MLNLPINDMAIFKWSIDTRKMDKNKITLKNHTVIQMIISFRQGGQAVRSENGYRALLLFHSFFWSVL